MRKPLPSTRRTGAVLPLVTVCLVGLLGFVALAIDVGMMAVARTQAQSAADIGSLAGARTLNGSTGNNKTAAEAEARVLARAGAGRIRDAVDLRIIDGVRSRTGRIIDSQAQVGGWPELEAGTPWIDGDGDGMPDDWERAQSLDPANGADGPLDRDGDGYTNLEDWLNSLAG